MIADSNGYEEIIDGTKSPSDGNEVIEIPEKDNANTKKAKKENMSARMANKKGYRDLVMCTEGIQKLGEDSRRGGIPRQEKTK